MGHFKPMSKCRRPAPAQPEQVCGISVFTNEAKCVDEGSPKTKFLESTNVP